MSAKTIKDSNFYQTLTEAESISGNGVAGWVKDMRLRGRRRFDDLGFPTKRDEDWKYTSVAPIQNRSFQLNPDPVCDVTKDMFDDFAKGSELTYVFVNGIYQEGLSSWSSAPEGVDILSMAQALHSDAPVIKNALSHHSLDTQGSFAALNTALLRQGACLCIAKNKVLETPIHMIYINDAKSQNLMTSPRNCVVFEEGSQASILESHISFGERSYFANVVTDIFLKQNARCEYVTLQGQSLDAFHIHTMRVHQERDSHLHTFSIAVGAKIMRNNLAIHVDGEGAHAGLDGLYIASGKQHMDHHTFVDHARPNGTSSQLYKGIMMESGRAVFNGKILVRPGSQQTNAYQLNKNILLSPNAHVDTKPELEIFADDVRCTHGATIGQLNEDEVFYCQSRGIDKNTATRMLCCAFADDVLLRVSHTSVQDILLRYLKARVAWMG